MTPPSSEENSTVVQSKTALPLDQEMPEIVIQQIFETEMKQTFAGPLTPSSPSPRETDESKTNDVENPEIEGSKNDVKPKTVSIATQVNGSEDKGIQANSVKNCELKMKQMNIKNDSPSFISSSSSSTPHFLANDRMVISAQSMIDDEWDSFI